MKTTKIALIFVSVLMFVMLFSTALAQTGGDESPGNGTPTSVPAVGGAPAQPIKLATPVTVHLSGTTPISLTYKSVGNETISVTARSLEAEDILDPMLTVLDPDGGTLASNDNHRTNRTDLAPHDALIDGVTLSSAGRYTILVGGADGSGDGDVEVTVAAGSAVPVVTTPEPGNGPNETLNDRVPDTGPYTHTFDANEGDVVTITVRATDNQLDPKVSLLDSSGTELASNDDHDSTDASLGPYDSQIAEFTIPATGTYTVQINGFAGIGGTFELTIASGDGSTPVNPTPPPLNPTQPPANTTQVITGTVNANDVYTYTLEAKAGDVYTITVIATSQDFDPRVSIYLNNDYVTDNDDSGSTDPDLQATDARIYNWIFAEDGSYEIDVRGYQDSAGDFKMTLDKVATGAPTGLPSEDVQLGAVKSGDTYSQTFDAEAGDWVTITVRGLSNEMDPYVTLMSADGTVLRDNDDNGTGAANVAFYDAEIHNYHITDSGTYTIQVSGANSTTGQFAVTIGTLR